LYQVSNCTRVFPKHSGTNCLYLVFLLYRVYIEIVPRKYVSSVLSRVLHLVQSIPSVFTFSTITHSGSDYSFQSISTKVSVEQASSITRGTMSIYLKLCMPVQPTWLSVIRSSTLPPMHHKWSVSIERWSHRPLYVGFDLIF
jgi:hypothetical protein